MNKGLMILKWTAISILFIMFFGGVTMFLWNYVVPPLFQGPQINFWQAVALLLLSKLLLGGIGSRQYGGNRHPKWLKHRYEEKLSSMTPENRDRFKTKLWEKWCCHDDKKTSNPGSETSL